MRKYLPPVSIGLGVLFDLLFWEKSPGVSFPLFILLGLSAGYFLLRMEGSAPKKINIWLMLPILFFSIMSILRKEPLTMFLGYIFTLFCVILLAVSWFNGLWPSFGITDYIVNFLNLIGGMIALPWQERKDSAEPESGKGKKSLLPILRGIALSLPVWLIFIAMLASADLVFARQLDGLLKNFNTETLAEILAHLVLIALVGFLFFGVVLFAARRSAKTILIAADKPVISPFLGMIETVILLGGVIFLFGIFVLIQYRYLFSGQANITLEGFTYAEYARRGFGELLAVALLSIFLQKGLSQITRRESDKNRNVFTFLSVAIIVLVLVILVSAFQRLSLYEAAYGFTRLRTYPHVFMIWLGFLLAAIALMEVLGWQRYFANAVLLAAMGFGATLGILNVDQIIVQRNLQNAAAGMPLDAGYLATLSSDAIPALTENLTNLEMPEAAREGIAAALVCYRDVYSSDTQADQPWTSYHFSTQRAQRALSGVNAQLSGYRIDTAGWPVMVTSPGGKEYSCQRVMGMD